MRRRFRAFVEIVRSDREPGINEIARKSTIAPSSFLQQRVALRRFAKRSVRISIDIIFIPNLQPAIDVINAILYNVII